MAVWFYESCFRLQSPEQCVVCLDSQKTIEWGSAKTSTGGFRHWCALNHNHAARPWDWVGLQMGHVSQYS